MTLLSLLRRQTLRMRHEAAAVTLLSLLRRPTLRMRHEAAAVTLSLLRRPTTRMRHVIANNLDEEAARSEDGRERAARDVDEVAAPDLARRARGAPAVVPGGGRREGRRSVVNERR